MQRSLNAVLTQVVVGEHERQRVADRAHVEHQRAMRRALTERERDVKMKIHQGRVKND